MYSSTSDPDYDENLRCYDPDTDYDEYEYVRTNDCNSVTLVDRGRDLVYNPEYWGVDWSEYE